ncbi:MAG: hypothetical protein ACYDB7_14145 [Mycobacteriales bacterium]
MTAALAAAQAAAQPSGIALVTAFAGRLAGYVTAVAASVAVLFIALNGVKYIASSGNTHRQFEAKSGLVTAAVGLAIALSANLVVQLVVGALG